MEQTTNGNGKVAAKEVLELASPSRFSSAKGCDLQILPAVPAKGRHYTFCSGFPAPTALVAIPGKG